MLHDTESEANAPSRGQAEEGRWFRLHSQGKAASAFDSGIVKVAVAVMDVDVRRVMYDQPLLSQDKYQGRLTPYQFCTFCPHPPFCCPPSLHASPFRGCHPKSFLPCPLLSFPFVSLPLPRTGGCAVRLAEDFSSSAVPCPARDGHNTSHQACRLVLPVISDQSLPVPLTLVLGTLHSLASAAYSFAVLLSLLPEQLSAAPR